MGGVAAGIDATSFDEFWLWGSLVILVATMGIMSVTATPYMKRVREGCTRWADGTYTLSDDELDATLRGTDDHGREPHRRGRAGRHPVPHGVQARCVMARVSPTLTARIDSLARS